MDIGILPLQKVFYEGRSLHFVCMEITRRGFDPLTISLRSSEVGCRARGSSIRRIFERDRRATSRESITQQKDLKACNGIPLA